MHRDRARVDRPRARSRSASPDPALDSPARPMSSCPPGASNSTCPALPSVVNESTAPYGRVMARTLFTGGDVFDGTGEDPRPGDVVIEGDQIVTVGAPGTGDGDRAVDMSGKTVLPGFFD